MTNYNAIALRIMIQPNTVKGGEEEPRRKSAELGGSEVLIKTDREELHAYSRRMGLVVEDLEQREVLSGASCAYAKQG